MPGARAVEAVVLRSFRYGEADRVLHLLTRERGRVGAVAKGVRRTRSRVGARLEPLSHVEVVLHAGRGELSTVGSVELLDSAEAVRADPYRLGVALIGIETVTRLFPEPDEPNGALFDGLLRFLVVAGELPPGVSGPPARDPLALGFALKLLALAGWGPRLDACASCGSDEALTAYDVVAGGATCPRCGGFAVRPASLAAVHDLLGHPLGAAPAPDPAAAAQVLRIVRDSVGAHASSGLRTLDG
jgi:DNA repair protein RecO (recombination protein O)